MKKLICVTDNYPDGQKICAARVVYEKAIDPLKIEADTFAVEGRSITGFSVCGDTVILDLDSRDAEAGLIPRPQHEPIKPGEKIPLSPPVNEAPAIRKPVEVKLCQRGDIYAPDGTVFPGMDDFIVSRESIEPVVGDFTQHEFNGIGYNLFTPENPDGKKLPLVVFLHDAFPCGDDTKLTLSQGSGAVTWADAAWQKKHPCYVLAPQIRRGIRLTNDRFEADPLIFTLKELIDFIADNESIDKDRIYCTGQSMGCEAFCELNILFPEYFAASMLVAGQWDPVRMGEKCSKCKFWILVSNHDEKAFPGMNAVTQALEANGARVGRYCWNGKSSPREVGEYVREALRDDVNVRYTVFQGSSVVPEGQEDNGGSNHVNTWPIAYGIDGVKEWLFSAVRVHSDDPKEEIEEK